MRSRSAGVLLATTLGITLALLWVLGTRQGVATAAPIAGGGRSASAAPAAPAAEIHVCPAGQPTCDYASIQAAVDAAAPNDVILVAAGTYTDVHQRAGITQVVYITKSITIKGGYTVTNWTTPNPSFNVSFVNAQANGRVLVISGLITAHIEGLYITNGNAAGLGGGPHGHDGVGGGLYVVSATVTISNCTFSGNVASDAGLSSGGGIYLWDADASVVNNELFSNAASDNAPSTGWGGGIAASGGNVTLEGNYIHANSAHLQNAPSDGGGIYLESGSPVLRDNLIQGNTAARRGGGIFVEAGAQPVLINNVLIANTAGSNGAGIYAKDASLHMFHTTVVSNTGGDGSGLYIDNSTVLITNTIVANQAVGITTANGSAVSINSILWHGNGQNTGGAGITVQNQFTGTPSFEIDGYHILSSSAALDRGVVTSVSHDLDGEGRSYGAAPDLGADEWWPTPVASVLAFGPDVGFVGLPNFFNALALPQDATPPITYTWSPTPDGGQGTAWVTYTWTTTGTQVLTITAQNLTGSAITTTTVLIRAYITTTIHPTASATLLYTAPRGLTTTVYAPPNAVSQSLVLRYTPRPSHTYPLSPDMGFGNHAFDLEAFLNNSLIPHFEFSRPLTITINYTDDDIAGLVEDGLRLYYWDGSQWVDAATTCIPTSTYHLYTQENRLEVPICHLSRWGMMGLRKEENTQRKMYLPLVLRRYP